MRKHIECAAMIAAFAAASGPAFGQDAQGASEEEIIITATRAQAGASRDTLGASVTAISAADIETRQTRIISDLLRDVPGVSVSRIGAVGGQTQIRMRGAEGNHTLVLIDGVEVADPYFGEFDFAALIADDVARIEVLRGQQSALYGSDAIGGVIHYITASGAEARGLRGRVEYGSSNSWNASARVAGVSGPVDFAGSAGYQSTDGGPTARNGVRDVGAETAALSGRLVVDIAANARIRAVGRYALSEADTNDQDFGFPPGPTFGFAIDSDDYSESEAAYGLVSGEWELMDGAWSNTVTIQGVNASRKAFSGGAFDNGSEGTRLKASYVTSLAFETDAARHTLTGAVDVEREGVLTTTPGAPPPYSERRTIDNTGYVAQYDAVVAGRFGFGAAYRYDSNDAFDDADTYRVQASYLFASGTRVHAAAGSGVKNPGYSELYGFAGSTYLGNPNLTPERSNGWEAGVEQRFWGDSAWIDLTYFTSLLEDEIALDCALFPLCTPINLPTESEREGVEISAQATLGQWRLFGSYTWLESSQNGVEEVRRAPHAASVNLSWRAPSDAFGAFLTVRYNGEMLDNNFTLSGPSPIDLPAFTLVNLGGDWRVSDSLELYGRVENALDEAYEEIYTYRAPERAFYLGLRAGF
ncbi:MAG: TonB-dependent receptor plug domain-containing protein [Alphaproteobacteria bacterium]|nr:TonB-dependent receptor plug domain-containing protein [Alphaproteobacteria bacterium]